MIQSLQIIGVLFSMTMLYFTFLYYKKEHYDMKGLLFWSVAWIAFLVLSVFPETVYGVMEVLNVGRTVDFFVIAGFLFFSVIIFRMYIILKETQKKVEEIVTKIAIKKAKK